MIEFKPLDGDSWAEVKSTLGVRLTPDTRGIVAYDTEKQTYPAIAIFNNFTFSSACIHWYISNPFVLRHGLLTEVYRYAFEQCGLKVLLGYVPADNEKALTLNKHIGMREAYRIPDGYKEGVDTVLMEGTPDDLVKWKPKVAA